MTRESGAQHDRSTPNATAHAALIRAIIVFSAGVLAAIILVRFVSTDTLSALARQGGIIGILVVGAMYSMSITSPTATVVLANLHGQFHPLAIAAIGALGSLAYDELIFTIARKETKTRTGERLHRALERLPIPSWLWFTIGGLIIASPLPDELASGMLGMLTASRKRFAAFSFAMNFLGILIITQL